jgi:hypothetical protein
MSGALQKFVIDHDVLWTCPGDRMELVGYDLRTGDELRPISIPEKYRASELIKSTNWQAVRLYNFGQPLMVQGRLHVLVTKQEFEDPPARKSTEPGNRVLAIYKLENGKMKRLPDFPELGCFPDYHTTWQDCMIFSSSGYDAVARIFIIRITL